MIQEAHNIHMIGIKGVGMTALAQVLLGQGKIVTGSDTDETFFTDQILKDLQVQVMHPFGASNLPEVCDLVIRSAAYGDDHPEVQAALAKKIPVMLYAEALGELSKNYFSIGVAGTHGKTTTTAMLGLAYEAANLDPTVIVGTQVPQFDQRNARVGKSDLFIAETCEYRRHFLNFSPQAEIITNIDDDHLDYFKNSKDLQQAFQEYLDLLPDGATAVLGIDTEPLRELATKNQERLHIVTYGMHPDSMFRSGPLNLQVPGQHNILNATAVIALTQSLPEQYRVPLDVVKKSLTAFRGTTRRLEKKGEAQGRIIYDDYAHHPTEIKASLQGLRSLYPKQKITAVFMSHTFSRTKALLPDFATSFTDADTVVVNDIYASARESKDPDMTGKRLAYEIGAHHPYTTYISNFDEAAAFLISHSQPGDVIVTMGAGDNWRIGEMVLKHFNVSKSVRA